MSVSRSDAVARLSKIKQLKDSGNVQYVSKIRSNWAAAAVTYGEMLQEMMSFEKEYTWRDWDNERIVSIFERGDLETFSNMKPVVFLNLAAANIKLGGYEGSRRCCNAALLFINDPDLLLEDMGLDDREGGDITEDVMLASSSIPPSSTSSSSPPSSSSAASPPLHLSLRSLAAKAFYRRALSIFRMIEQGNGQSGSSACTETLAAAGGAEGVEVSKVNLNSGLAAIRGIVTYEAVMSSLQAALGVLAVDAEASSVIDSSNAKDKGKVKTSNANTALREDILRLRSQVQDMISSETQTQSQAHASDISVRQHKEIVVLSSAIVQDMQINGGRCARRQGMWSQTVDSVTVYLPLSLFVPSIPTPAHSSSSSYSSSATSVLREWSSALPTGSMTLDMPSVITEQDPVVATGTGFGNGHGCGHGLEGIQVYLDKAEVRVEYQGISVMHCVLEYNIYPCKYNGKANGKERASASANGTTWTLESLYSSRHTLFLAPTPSITQIKDSCMDSPSHLVLYLSKVPSLEWYPGCEWWDRVFIDDEPIDTMTCQVGSGSQSLTELPVEAIEKAKKEHARFMAMSVEEQEKELANMAVLKKQTTSAVQAHLQECRGGIGGGAKGSSEVQDKDRGEMLDALSTEFPNIFFGSK